MITINVVPKSAKAKTLVALPVAPPLCLGGLDHFTLFDFEKQSKTARLLQQCYTIALIMYSCYV